MFSLVAAIAEATVKMNNDKDNNDKKTTMTKSIFFSAFFRRNRIKQPTYETVSVFYKPVFWPGLKFLTQIFPRDKI